MPSADLAHHALLPHPTSLAGAVRTLEVALRRPSPVSLELDYTIVGDISQLRLPEPRPPVRADGLWRHTCFEAFIGRGDEYWEYNLSPSGAWAAYHFTGHREGMAPMLKGAPPQITLVEAKAESVTLSARIDLGWLARAAGGGAPLRLGLAAVIDDKAHVLSYWALAHPAEKPDFHHADSFVVSFD